MRTEYGYRCKHYMRSLKRIGAKKFIDESGEVHLCGLVRKGKNKGKKCSHLIKIW